MPLGVAHFGMLFQRGVLPYKQLRHEGQELRDGWRRKGRHWSGQPTDGPDRKSTVRIGNRTVRTANRRSGQQIDGPDSHVRGPDRPSVGPDSHFDGPDSHPARRDSHTPVPDYGRDPTSGPTR